jgi:DNA-binding NarL/FixJ family response regulator
MLQGRAESRHILEKLNLHNPAELILYAVRKGIVS